ncbi:hypothetical protein MTZ49_14795 [Entomomonas sp. E2T0]|uniref:hypothetical protein n=1 Tax=Entomomonas sp. E2T0 TaxID=2930213 RepID=UPI002228207C|nr:hypothetical protein [Entomomonas sp. E2T0]UYZ83839.1 hypothetical protein MTZ49_14795 [Entomomonas sp. E2T0]
MSNTKLKDKDFIYVVKKYNDLRKDNPCHRYASSDYCFNYFQLKQTKAKKSFSDDMEYSCNVLGFYLASWGMYRGSSYLLQNSASIFKGLIEYIDEMDKVYWTIDVPEFTDENIEFLISLYNQIAKKIKLDNRKKVTLITKIMLGIWGCVPAYDSYFTKTFSNIFAGECAFTSFNKKSLESIKKFYEAYQLDIDCLAKDGDYRTLDFNTGEMTNLPYTKSKIIDMYGFQKSYK